MNDFEEWLEGLETQTLTDELKESIINFVNTVAHAEYLRGYAKAAEDTLEIIKNFRTEEDEH